MELAVPVRTLGGRLLLRSTHGGAASSQGVVSIGAFPDEVSGI
jgi:hypothetical protein